MKTSVIRTYYSSSDAYLAKHQLENENVFCFLENETISSVLPGYTGMFNSGIKLRVDFENIQRAIDILENNEVLQCPKCFSTEVLVSKNSKRNNIFIAIIGLLIASPIGKVNSYWECSKCNQQF